MDKDNTLSATDWFNKGLKCFNKPDGIGADCVQLLVQYPLSQEHTYEPPSCQ